MKIIIRSHKSTFTYVKSLGYRKGEFKLSNGHSPANLSNSSTRQKFASFGEFEYSPKWPFWKIGRTRYIRQHSPTYFARTRYIRRHSPPYFARTRYIRRHLPPYLARTRYIRSHSPKGFFEKNVTRLDTFARVIRRFGKFGASGHCLI